MNKTVFTLGTLALLGFVQPASAMMCGGGQQAQASASGGMMCGAIGQAADDPMADKPRSPQQSSGMMCPCCRNMAMMRGGAMGGSDGGMQHHNMPGMDMPKQ